jgi:hypothetical protein
MPPLDGATFFFVFLFTRVFLSSHGLNSLLFLKKKGKYHPNNACVSNKNLNKLSIVLSKVKKTNTTVVYNSYFLELFFILLVAISGVF